MQRAATLGPGMASSRGLAVDGDRVRAGDAQPIDPVGEARLEQVGVERRDHFAQRVVAGNTTHEGKKTAKEGQMLTAPQRQLDEIVSPGHRAAQQKQKQLRQRIQHLASLPRVPQSRKLRQKRNSRYRDHGTPPTEVPYES